MERSHLQAWQIDRLLLRREAEFARIHALESAIEERLGEPYPFPPPEIVPDSLQKRPKGTAKPQKKARTGSQTVRKLRPLINAEVAYEIRIRQSTGVQKERHQDRAALEKLLNLPGISEKILSIKTLGTSGEAVEELFVRE